MRAGMAVAVAVTGMVLGCSRKEPQPPSPVAKPDRPASKQVESVIEAPAAGQTPPPPHQPPAPAETIAATTDAAPQAEPGIAELNAALQAWVFKHNNPPKDFSELVKAGLLKKIPTPPSGKRYRLNPQTMSVTLE